MPFISTTKHFGSRSGGVLLCTCLISAFTLVGLAVSARAWLRRDNPDGLSNMAKASTRSSLFSSRISSQRQRIEGETISLGPNGFEPGQLTRPAGPFLLIVGNESRLPSLTLVLKSDVGLPLLSILVPQEKRLWSDIVDLPPGNYKLTEVAHPGWVCSITTR